MCDAVSPNTSPPRKYFSFFSARIQHRYQIYIYSLTNIPPPQKKIKIGKMWTIITPAPNINWLLSKGNDMFS